MIIGVHQPNFLPWIGFFNKIFLSDCFILLDDVKYPGAGAGNWVNRNRILISGKPVYVTVPICRSDFRNAKISDVEIFNLENWKKKFFKTVIYNYGKAPFLAENRELVDFIMASSDIKLINFNMGIIRKICEMLEINFQKILLSSELGVMSKSTYRIRDLITNINGSTYLSGNGSQSYLNTEILEAAGIGTIFQENRYPVYKQVGSNHFIEQLSILDWLFNIGRDRTYRAIESSLYHG